MTSPLSWRISADCLAAVSRHEPEALTAVADHARAMAYCERLRRALEHHDMRLVPRPPKRRSGR
jgi:hypothetical protein